MTHAVYEFPLNEKVRSYLRLEQLYLQLRQVDEASNHWQYVQFFDGLFTLLDLLERLDIRNDVYKDLDHYEKNLQAWSQHPKIDRVAVNKALDNIAHIRSGLKQIKRVGSGLREDKFLSAMRPRFAIPGATCSFDLPSLNFWLHQSNEMKHTDIAKWMGELDFIETAIKTVLSFLREGGRFQQVDAPKAFHQGVADDKHQLIRVYCDTNDGYYPVLSGNKYRYAIRFMWFDQTQQGSSVEQAITFKLACC